MEPREIRGAPIDIADALSSGENRFDSRERLIAGLPFVVTDVAVEVETVLAEQSDNLI
jgi:hypothetical protein